MTRTATRSATSAIIRCRATSTPTGGDEKCDVCGGKTGVHQHVDDNRDGVCDGCGRNMDGSFRCNLCPFWEQYRGIPVAGWFLTAFHFFYHLICQIVSWR